MLLYLIIPAVLWLLSCQLLSRSKGQKGFDIFFWHFILLGLEALAALLLLDYFQVPSVNRITLGIVGIHTIVLFGYSIKAFVAANWRRNGHRLPANINPPNSEPSLGSTTSSL